MTEIKTNSNVVYKYDEDSGEIYRNDVLVPKSKAEPIFVGNNPPQFAGILMKDGNQIISLSGNINSVDDISAL